METGRELLTDPWQVRKDYIRRLDEYIAKISRACRRVPVQLGLPREGGRETEVLVLDPARVFVLAIEKLLGAKVESIRTSLVHGKVKRQGRYSGRRSDWKKAYVRLRDGEKMPEFLEGA